MTGRAFTDILETLVARVQAATRRADVAQLELELRLSAPADFFYARFAACIETPLLDRTSPQYSGTHTQTTELGASRLRVERCEQTQRVLSTTLKTKVEQSADFRMDQGRLRLDVALEQPAAPPPPGALGALRLKQRNSFRFTSAPSWRVDFTRVDGAPGRPRAFEIEIELDSATLRCCKTSDDAERLAKQLAIVLDAIGVTRPPGADDEVVLAPQSPRPRWSHH